MSTYSINTGTSTEAFKLIDINSALTELADNTNKDITPHDIRDGVYTIYENIIFKPTKSNSIEYIGIDQTDFYEKIFLGKKQISGVNVLTANLLNSDVDLFIYNTKPDTDLTYQNTKIAFLAGTSQSVFFYGNTLSVPTIEAKLITNSYGKVLDFDINNRSYVLSGATYSGGNINIISRYGNILLNGVVLPTYAQNLPAAVSDGSILKYTNIGGVGYLQWDSNTPTLTASITKTGTFSISASPLLINGYDVMFSSSIQVPVAVGGIAVGSTFSNMAVTRMLQLILYPYIAPILTLTSTYSTVEITSTSLTVGFSYSITKVIASSSISSISTSPTFITDTSTPISYLNSAVGINAFYGTTASYSSATNFSTYGNKTFTFSVVDNTGGSSSINYNVNAVYPIFYGTSTTASATQSTVQGLLGSFTKIISNNPNQTIPLQGNGVCLYYCVPSIYNTGGSVSSVIETSTVFNVNTIFRGDATAFTMSLYSPSGYWGSIVYNCYIYSPLGIPTTTTLGISPLYTANYQFTF